ncbi:MAG: hypothetical protein HY747_10755, partial [Elusimicrobia bacterium]|nr:hypothetical protein [Elusimicrobiota bacterium]
MASRLRQSNGDDHPEAAGKHLADAGILQTAGRHDGAAYLAGYVVECCLKTVVLIEIGMPIWNSRKGHDLRFLSVEALRLAVIPGARTARYAPFQTIGHPIYDATVGWRETLRYREPGYVLAGNAQSWLDEAKMVFQKTIVSMRLDGVI